MEITANETYRIKGDSKYFKNKYGTSNPDITIEGRDTELWPNGGWGMQDGNPACLSFAMRAGFDGIPWGEAGDGKVGAFGELVDASELEEITEEKKR